MTSSIVALGAKDLEHIEANLPCLAPPARVLPASDRRVVPEDHAACRELVQERQTVKGAVVAEVAARHWLAVEWPLSELQRSLPDAFPSPVDPSR